MNQRKLTIAAAALASAFACASAGAVDSYSTSVTPNINDPRNVNESLPYQGQLQAAPGMRGDNRNLPNPSTPMSVHEAGPQTMNPVPLSESVRGGVGATAADTNRSGMYDSGDRGVKTPSSGGNDAQQRAPIGGTGISTLPSRNNPASVSENAPQNTGREVSSGPVRDDRNMPNPKTPANVSESAPAKAGTEQGGTGMTR